MATILDDAALRRRRWSAAVPLVLLIALVAFALPGVAQSTMYDLEDAEFDFSGWNGQAPQSDSVSQGVMGTFLVNGGGSPGMYELPDTWKVRIFNATTDTCDFYVDYGGNTVYTGSADVSMGVDDFVIPAGVGGLSLYLAFGTSSGDAITVPGDCSHSLVFGMDGSDQINGNIVGSGGYGSRDVFFGGDRSDDIRSYEGDDILFGDWFDDSTWNGDDDIHCGAGNDWCYTGGGNSNQVLGEAGEDWLFGGEGIDDLYGGTGRDHIEGGGGADYIEGNDGCDNLFGDESAVHPMPGGTDGGDEIHGGSQDDFIRGGGGNDFLYGGSGEDCIDGGAGADWLEGGSGDDYLHDMDGTGGDTLLGGSENDTIHCLDGDDDDDYDGGSDNDTFWVDSGDDEIGTPSGTNSLNTSPTPPPTGYSAAGSHDEFENFGRTIRWSAGRSC